ncbi:lipid A biosynthesis palmitoleoyl acyltransferase [Erwinia sp. OLTSP20]|uniref:kdo(2)-lipid IV(A) palmitoleoyltransferase n=1 Tax=unclassified Erwinia TaxID=2622719 RepID=UPI000C176BEB|nr:MULTISPECIES: kdo(2)-lipid IV(A) palmitoleoyltransferase [unclassified Erwinia]PIJ48255.1 lipid A biosynthesis palmitoleoyl acyltransferase [Erwinia sp. OAMSP11]PIJ68755.1 lipid A biosynthesis palmitoleoyl acyltransferase [Erwinia sp. OLSSP12]PIJ78930.1 lipid A biosynthesis palmitoleoyl acyltransferase [Erwinia sp. OLCASP19]PIJ79540.1 lipid A biosynthesis palmitoleoyl acyltransferase [Erwinia sp. OLMTSP26]PIJ81498.1 lipid A biosynthesis palmitoleoyl acyltransferase [Erwinia sp. OLMDSP33]
MKHNGRFSSCLLHPRYWFTWFGLGLLWLLTQLPYPLLMRLGAAAGRLSRFFLRRRERITRRNIELCFPGLGESEKERMIAGNFASLGMALAETGIAWFWSDRAVKKLFQVTGLCHLQQARQQKRGVMVIGVHFMSLELGGRISGLCQPMMAMYRPHNNRAMEWAQTKGRMRSNKAMINRHDLRGMVQALKQGEAVWFAPDQDYGPKGSVFAPLFAVEKTATTNGTFVLSRLARPAMLSIVLIRNANNHGYQLIIDPQLENYPLSDEIAAAAYMNKVIESQILRAPEQYLWMHRRFKTRPAGEMSLYF